MYKIFTAIIISFLFLISSPVLAAQNAAEKVLKITADSAILIEATTGRVIYEKDADRVPACKYDKNDDVYFGA